MKRGNGFLKKSLILIFIALFLIGIFFVLFKVDIYVVKFIESLRNIFLDYFFIGITFLSKFFVVLFFLISLFLAKKSNRRWIIPLVLTIALSSITGFLIKILIKRPRPFIDGSVSVLSIIFYFMKNNFNTWNFSFPSGDTIFVFCVLPIISKEFKKFRYYWLGFAILVAFSRMYLGVHYLTDVIAGAAMGYLIGSLIVFLEEKYKFGLRLVKRIGL